MNRIFLRLRSIFLPHKAQTLMRIGPVIAGLAMTAPLHAQTPGSLDTGFAASNGVIPALAIGIGDDRARAMALQPDGKIILTGVCTATISTSVCLARLNPDGTLDTTFDGPGTSPGNGKFQFSMVTIGSAANAVAVQPDGKIVVLGTCAGKFCLARLNDNGSFDPSFVGPDGTGAGRFQITIGTATDIASTLKLQADGKIVAVGSCDDGTGGDITRYCAARLNADGSFDAAFDGPTGALPGNGRFLIPQIGTTNVSETARAVVVQADGRIVIVGSCFTTYVAFCIARLNASSGSYDTSFDGPSGSGNGRIALTLDIATFDNAYAVAVQPDGKIVMAGECGFGLGSFCVARINVNGTMDDDFAAAGIGYVSFTIGSNPSFHTATAVALQPDGKIVVAGQCLGNSVRVFCAARLNSDGSFDLSFDGPNVAAGDGRFQVTVGNNQNYVTAMAIQPDGKIVIAGYCDNGSNDDFCVARLNGGPFPARQCSLDIDGDGKVLATTDALIHARVALGVTGSAVINGITFPAGATRTTWGNNTAADIRRFLVTQCGMNLP